MEAPCRRIEARSGPADQRVRRDDLCHRAVQGAVLTTRNVKHFVDCDVEIIDPWTA
jgi:hypothetical protein